MENTILFTIFLIFLGSSILGTLAMFARQSLMIVYMIIGMLIGPAGLGLSLEDVIIKQIGEVGIIVLLFLLGLHLDPHNLISGAKKSAFATLFSALLFAGMGYQVGIMFGFDVTSSIVIGLAMVFSSTIISLKLLPSNILHHGSIGGNMITVLLIQDVLAIVVLIVLKAAGSESVIGISQAGFILMGLFSTIVISYVGERLIIVPLFQRFEKNREYLFLIALAWCFSMSELAHYFKLSHEIGAFIGGVSIASTSNVSLYLAECFKPLRDFFLVLFFFSIGAQFDLRLLPQLYDVILVMAVLMIVAKPIIFRYLFTSSAGEEIGPAWELGIRLGQVSEFSILVAEIAERSQVIDVHAAFVIKGTTMVTFFISSMWVTRRYRTPVGEIS